MAKWDREQARAAVVAALKATNNAKKEHQLQIKKNQDIIRQRVANGQYSLKLSKQQYLKHVEGTKQFEQYTIT